MIFYFQKYFSNIKALTEMKMTSGAISVPKAASGPLPSSEKKSFDAISFID